MVPKWVPFERRLTPRAAKSASMSPPFRHDLGQRDRYGFPNPGLAPAPKPTVNRVPVALFGRHIAPRHAAAQPPENSIDDRTVVFGWPPAPSGRRINRQQTLQNTPFRFAQIAPAQAPLEKGALNQPPSLASTNLSTPSNTLSSFPGPPHWPQKASPASNYAIFTSNICRR